MSEFEPAREEDIPQLVALLDVLFGIEQDFRPDPEKQARGLRRLIEARDTAIVMVVRDPEAGVVGMVSAQLVISTAEGAYSAWVEDMVIAEAFRAQGLGRQLLDATLAWAKSNGATRAQLLVDLDNAPALGYYDHLGWQATRLGARRISLRSDS